MSEKHCCCKHRNENTSLQSDAGLGAGRLPLLAMVFSSVLPHFFCCFMPVVFTVIVGGAMGAFFHDYWYVVSAIAAVSVSLVFYMVKAEPFSFLRFGGNVMVAMFVALCFNVFLHPAHDTGAHEGEMTIAYLEEAAHAHVHNHSHGHGE
ncbi:MAG: hypothetical protein NZ828_08945 [Alphaproteobacteria bacterium]|nr:hypothetical protein [Alphaproteobacteria bacterium]